MDAPQIASLKIALIHSFFDGTVDSGQWSVVSIQFNFAPGKGNYLQAPAVRQTALARHGVRGIPGAQKRGTWGTRPPAYRPGN